MKQQWDSVVVVFILSAIVLVAAIGIGAGLLLLTRPDVVEVVVIPPEPTWTPEPSATPAPLQIYVTGEVNNPQTRLVLLPGSRVQDAVDAAGGYTENADLERINPVGILRDGDHIHVYSLTDEGLIETYVPTPQGGPIVYINTAGLEELDSLPGIGPAIAQRILDYREENGPFANLESLLQVSGIGPSTIERLEGLVSFD